MKIYAVTGLGADETVFSLLKLDYPIVHLNWIAPINQKESIESYAKRLSVPIDNSEEFVLLGLSFGGLMVTEMSKFLKPAKTIVLSSAAKRAELKWWFRGVGNIGILKFIPSSWFWLPKSFLMFVFGTKNKTILYPMLERTDRKLVQWSINRLTTWEQSSVLDCVVKINGTKNKLMNAIPDNITHLVKNGQHFMIMDKADEVSQIINDILLKINSKENHEII